MLTVSLWINETLLITAIQMTVGVHRHWRTVLCSSDNPFYPTASSQYLLNRQQIQSHSASNTRFEWFWWVHFCTLTHQNDWKRKEKKKTLIQTQHKCNFGASAYNNTHHCEPFIFSGSQWSCIEKAQTLCDSCPGRCCAEKIAKLAHCILAASQIIPVPTHSPSNVTILHHPNILLSLLSGSTVKLLLNRCVMSCRVQCNRNLRLEGAFVAPGTHLTAAHSG